MSSDLPADKDSTSQAETNENRDRLPNADDFATLQETVRKMDAAGAWGSDLVRDAVLRLFVMPSARGDDQRPR